jgi:hypothetical protein
VELLESVNESNDPSEPFWSFIAYRGTKDNLSSEKTTSIPKKEISDSGSSVPSTDPAIGCNHDPDISNRIIESANFTCQFCGKIYLSFNTDLQGAHIYEIKSARTNRARQILGKFTSKQQTAIYFGLGIGGLNDPRNVLCLCGTCNKHFDDKNIAIQPGSYELLISPRIFSEPIAHVGDIPNYQELNKRNKRVEFVDAVAVPGDKLLERRLRKFQRKQATPDFQD